MKKTVFFRLAISLAIFLNGDLSATAQQSIVTLQPGGIGGRPGFTVTVPVSRIVTQAEKYKVPQGISRFAIAENHLQKRQFIYQNRMDTNVTKHPKYVTSVPDVLKDSSCWFQNYLDESIKMLTYYNTNGEKCIILDTENDYDFTNDPVYTASQLKENVAGYGPGSIRISNLQVWDKSQQKVLAKKIFVYPYIGNFYSYRPVTDTLAYAEIKHIQPVNAGFIQHPKLPKPFIIYTICTSVDGVFDSTNTIVSYQSIEEPIPSGIHPDKWYAVGDTLLLYHSYFKAVAVSADGLRLTLQYINTLPKVSCPFAGCTTVPVSGTNLLNGQPWQLYKTKERQYTLIDFWGSWCGPCKELTPDLLSLYDSSNRKLLSIVSVAYDKDSSLPMNYVRANNMRWIQLWDDNSPASKASSLCRKLRITQFPSFLLIDPQGRILLRESGRSGLEKIKTAMREKGLLHKS